MAALVGGGGVVALRAAAPSTSSVAAVERVRRRGRGRGTMMMIRCGGMRGAGGSTLQAANAEEEEEDHYRTLRVRPGASKGEVKKAFRHLALQYHPDVVHSNGSSGGGAGNRVEEFQRISVAYQAVMGSMREAEERLEYWRRRYGLSDEELDRYRYYLNEDVHDDDDW